MCPEEFEELLRTLPVRSLPPAAEAELLLALTGQQLQTRRWWRSGVPLWQAAAACILVATAVGFVTRYSWSPSDQPRAHAADTLPRIVQDVQPAQPIFAQQTKSSYDVDIRRWQPAGNTMQSEDHR